MLVINNLVDMKHVYKLNPIIHEYIFSKRKSFPDTKKLPLEYFSNNRTTHEDTLSDNLHSLYLKTQC